MWRHRRSTIDQVGDDTLEIAQRDHHRRGGGGGAALATLISAVALVFSAYSFYESVLRAPEIAVFAPPLMEYTDPDRPESPFEVFVIPLTIANDGARSATVLSINLAVTNRKTKKTKHFYAAQTGTWGQGERTAYAPVQLTGRAAYTGTIQFFPRNGETIARIIDFEPGTYDFEVTLDTAAVSKPWPLEATSEPKPLRFSREIAQLDYRNFNGNGTMEMWAPDHRASSSSR